MKEKLSSNQKVKIKICGITNPLEIEYVNGRGIDYVGFVFSKSKGQVTREQVVKLSKGLESSIQKVGVFVNEDPKYVLELLNDNVIDVAQFHGRESIEEIKYIKQSSQKQVIKAITKNYNEEIKIWEKSGVDFLLFDSGKGTGETFNWESIGKVQKPFFLAGGLQKENVRKGISALNPFGVDVSSGVEDSNGKSKEKIKKFVDEIGGLYE